MILLLLGIVYIEIKLCIVLLLMENQKLPMAPYDYSFLNLGITIILVILKKAMITF
jgi:hypothetical protein